MRITSRASTRRAFGYAATLAVLLFVTASLARAQEPCPGAVRFDVDGPSTDIDPGWTGMAHDGHYVGLAITMGISGCAGSMQGSCGACTLSGPLANGGGATFNNRRCVDESWLACVNDADCVSQGAVGPCHVFFGPPLPYSGGGVGVCVVNEITSAGSGSIDVDAGDVSMNLPYKATIYSAGDLSHPCPQCLSGSCDSGARAGMGCTTNGTSPVYGPVSFDCPPLAGANIGVLVPSGLTLSTAMLTKTLTVASPDCRGVAGKKCLCDTCNNLAATPCATNVDCIAVGATICGGPRCFGGVNAGAPCPTLGATTLCPGSSCAIPGYATKPNGCDDLTCSPNGADTDSSNEGECSAGPFDTFCFPFETFRGCIFDTDCPRAGDTCSGGKNRECFTDNGALGGSIFATGLVSPPAANEAAPTLVALTCIPPTTASSTNVVGGFPGPGRLTLPSLLTLADETADGTVPSGGGTVTTDTENDGATPSDPLETTVYSPNGGEIIIDEQAATGTPPGGFTFLGKQANITAPPSSPGFPLVIDFRIDASRIPAGQNETTIAVFKNGVAVPACTGLGATPDPCVATRALLGDGDVQLTIRTSTASTWNFGTLQSLCPSTPDPSCRLPVLPQKASVTLVNNVTDDKKDKLSWKWVKGQATSLNDFGNPVAEFFNDTYALCVYDGAGLLKSFTVPPGGICGGKNCWEFKGSTGIAYKDTTLGHDGILKIQLKAGVDGKAKIGVTGKGANLGMPSLASLTSPLAVQLRHASNSVCWSAQYSFPPATKNDGTQFKDKAD